MTRIQKLLNEPLVCVGVIEVGLNAATVHTWPGYACAVVTALVRFLVTGPLTPTS